MPFEAADTKHILAIGFNCLGCPLVIEYNILKESSLKIGSLHPATLKRLVM